LKTGQAFAPFLGYSCIRSDGDFKCRGVAILHKAFIKANVINLCLENISSNNELLCVKFQLGFYKSIIVAVINRHPDYMKLTLKRDYDSFENIISSLQSTGSQYFIVGDFNLRESYISPLLRTLKKFDLIQIVEKATRLNNLLDLIICPIFTHILSHNVYDAGLADHRMTDVTFALPKPKPVKKTVAFRQFSRVDPIVLLS
jgi:exonuclease III